MTLKFPMNEAPDLEDRHWCELCGYAPEEHEHIVLIEVVGEIKAKFCDDCAERLLRKGAQLEGVGI